MTEYTLTHELAQRLLKAMAWVERQQQQGPSGTVDLNIEVPNVQEVTIDDPLVTQVDGDYTYVSAHVEAFNAETGELEELGAVWLTEVNGRELVAGETMTAIQSGERTISGETRIVFATGMPCCVAEAAAAGFFWPANYWS